MSKAGDKSVAFGEYLNTNGIIITCEGNPYAIYGLLERFFAPPSNSLTRDDVIELRQKIDSYIAALEPETSVDPGVIVSSLGVDDKMKASAMAHARRFMEENQMLVYNSPTKETWKKRLTGPMAGTAD